MPGRGVPLDPSMAIRPPSYTPPPGARHPGGSGMLPDDDDAYDAPWDMAANPALPANVSKLLMTKHIKGFLLKLKDI